MYRRIADIRNKTDADDVIDELIDRFGDVPSSVMGLIQVALIRNMASSYGICEIRQNDTSLLLYVNDIRNTRTGDLLDKLGKRANLRLENKPYIQVQFPKRIAPLKMLTEVFN